MLSFLSLFWIFSALYHIFVTITVYGLELFSHSFPSLIREGIWCLFILGIFLCNYKQRKEYWKKWKRSWIFFIFVCGFWVVVSYFLHERSLWDIFIGLKYGFWWTFILLSASAVGFFYQKTFKHLKVFQWIAGGLMMIVILGFLWQGAKLLYPDFFFSLGYGPLDDFQFGEKPPLYYLTGYEGTLRWQGLFSGPNNYGYFLVAFFPLILLFFGESLRKIKSWTLSQRINVLLVIIWMLAMGMTLSRSVLIAGFLVLIFINIPLLKKNKRLLIGGGIALVIVFGILSLLKRESTLWHLTSKLWAIPQIINAPLGYGLGTSGPAIHHNGSLLPENYFFQIMLDIWTLGFILWALMLLQIIGVHHAIKTSLENKKLKEAQQTQLLLLQRVQIWFLALLLIGLFLHVFEDSMVNYIFFIVYGILLGSLSREIHGGIPFFFPKQKNDKKEI